MSEASKKEITAEIDLYRHFRTVLGYPKKTKDDSCSCDFCTAEGKFIEVPKKIPKRKNPRSYTIDHDRDVYVIGDIHADLILFLVSLYMMGLIGLDGSLLKKDYHFYLVQLGDWVDGHRPKGDGNPIYPSDQLYNQHAEQDILYYMINVLEDRAYFLSGNHEFMRVCDNQTYMGNNVPFEDGVLSHVLIYYSPVILRIGCNVFSHSLANFDNIAIYEKLIPKTKDGKRIDGIKYINDEAIRLLQTEDLSHDMLKENKLLYAILWDREVQGAGEEWCQNIDKYGQLLDQNLVQCGKKAFYFCGHNVTCKGKVSLEHCEQTRCDKRIFLMDRGANLGMLGNDSDWVLYAKIPVHAEKPELFLLPLYKDNGPV